MTELVIDPWTPLEYKLRQPQATHGWKAPTWVGDHDRRLTAYKLLTSYRRNAAFAWLNTVEDTVRFKRREYGDAGVIVESIVDSLLGEDFNVVVEGAEDEGAPSWLLEQQEWLQQFFFDQRLGLRILEAEDNAVEMGDAVYVVEWDGVGENVSVSVYDPGFYFPVLDDVQDEYPDRIHLAWEFEEEQDDGRVKRYVRRITYELGILDALRKYPWRAEESWIVCLKSDGIWELENQERPAKWDDLDPARGKYTVRDLDTGFDFIPVVHVPNTIAGQEHFGQSSLATILQILDDLQSADTDMAAAAATTGTPPLAVDGTLENEEIVTATGQKRRRVTSYGPGTVFEGKVTVVDTSRALDALLKYVDHLLKRLAANRRLPATVLGYVDQGDIKSGIHLQLTFGPLANMVRKMRLSRDEKYNLLFTFIRRVAMLGGVLAPSTELPPATIAWGGFMPADVAVVVEQVTSLLEAHAISIETAVKMLMDAGLPIDDALEEIKRIQEQDFETAKALLDALDGDLKPVYERLGLEVPEDVLNPPPPPPVVQLPGPGGAQPPVPPAPET